MEISFFEEFPTTQNLGKLALLKGKVKVYIAAKSLAEFYSIKKSVKDKIRVKEFIYWPILEKREGYWISPFSRRQALLRIFRELKGKKDSVLLDLELPTTKNIWLYAFQGLNFWLNKMLIKEFIEEYKGELYLAEYYPEGQIKEKIMKIAGLHYDSKKVKVVKMLYHSLHAFKEQFVREELQRGVSEWGNNYIVSYGTIAKGINGNEVILTPLQLEKDLELANETGVKEVVIFRLGGISKEYVKVLNKF